MGHTPVGTASVRDPVAPLGSALRELGLDLLRQRDWQSPRFVTALSRQLTALLVPGAVVFRYGEEVGQMRLDSEPGWPRGKRRIGGDLGRVERQLP